MIIKTMITENTIILSMRGATYVPIRRTCEVSFKQYGRKSWFTAIFVKKSSGFKPEDFNIEQVIT